MMCEKASIFMKRCIYYKPRFRSTAARSFDLPVAHPDSVPDIPYIPYGP